MFTTGEIAKLCSVSVRTVQYYDERGILIPSSLSEGGRRLYTEGDLRKMKVICFLRETGLPINSIKELLEEESFENIFDVILSSQEKTLRDEIKKSQKKLSDLELLRKSLKSIEELSFDSLSDIASIMKNREKLKRIRTVMFVSAIFFGITEWGSILIWIFNGVRWPFLAYTILAVPYVFWIFNYYYKNISYICPCCHKVFKPDKKEFFFAKHTLTTRKLTCTCCKYKGFCVETCEDEENI